MGLVKLVKLQKDLYFSKKNQIRTSNFDYLKSQRKFEDATS